MVNMISERRGAASGERWAWPSGFASVICVGQMPKIAIIRLMKSTAGDREGEGGERKNSAG